MLDKGSWSRIPFVSPFFLAFAVVVQLFVIVVVVDGSYAGRAVLRRICIPAWCLLCLLLSLSPRLVVDFVLCFWRAVASVRKTVDKWARWYKVLSFDVSKKIVVIEL